MSHDPKLEIYKIKLYNKEDGRLTKFRESFRENIPSISALPKPIEDSHFYREFYKHFLNSIDLGKYKTNEKKDKAYKIAKDKLDDGSLKSCINKPTDDNFIISGLLQGGKYNVKRILGEVNDANITSDISTSHVVGDRFFFLLYAPINSHTGLLLIQGYTEVKISDVFRDHIKEYFQAPKKINCEFEIFVPDSLKDKYLKNAVFSSAKFSSEFKIYNGFEDIENKELELEVRIEIVDKSGKKSKYTNFAEMLKAFGNTVFTFPNDVKRKLQLFEKKSAKMQGTGKTFPIDFDDEDNIRPTILLKDQGIEIKAGKIPNFDQIEIFCRNLLRDIISEINPENAVKDI